MKRAGILNSDISRVLSYLGHTDCICIGDCGLPIPDEVERIDLALAFGEPTFMRTLELVVADMKVEKIVLAEEIKTQNPEVLKQVEALFADQNVEVEFVSHVELKEKTWDCKDSYWRNNTLCKYYFAVRLHLCLIQRRQRKYEH